MSKRNWFVAIGDMSGEYEGNPLSFDASEVYGPFTQEQALALAKMGDGFPHASKDVVAFPAVRLPFRKTKALIKTELATAQDEDDERSEEIEGLKRAARGE